MIVKEFMAEKLKVMAFDTRAAMGTRAGEDAAAYIKALLAQKESINVMFAAAPSQNEVLEYLKGEDGIDWSRINAYHMDEYVGLDEKHPAGFRNFLKRALFDSLPFKSVNLINGNAPDANEEAARYGKLLDENPLDLCVLGIGENGHIAFNDPPVADFNDKVSVKVVELEQRCRQQQVNDGCFAAIDQVPTHALSVTIPALTRAKKMVCVVPAPTKADAVYHTVNDPVSTACPATILRTHPDCCLYTDSDSAAKIL